MMALFCGAQAQRGTPDMWAMSPLFRAFGSAFAMLALSGTYAAGNVSSPYSSDLTISGGNGVYSNPLVATGSLPPGLSLSIVSGKLRLSGNPSANATYTFTVSCQSGDGQTATSSAQSVTIANTDPNFASVVALLHMEGTNGSTTFTDSSSHVYTQTSVNGAALDTSSPKFGTAAASFNGINQGINSNAPLGIGTQDFTIECWAKPNAVSTTQRLVSAQLSTTLTGVVILRLNSTGHLEAVLRDTVGASVGTYDTAGVVTASAYSFLTLCRKAGVIYMGINGAVENLGASTHNIIDSTHSTFYVYGSYVAGATEYFGGKLDEVRITEGVARYTSNFTPPTAPFPNS